MSFADFDIWPQYRFESLVSDTLWSGVGAERLASQYNPDRHEYERIYTHPPSYPLRLSAERGLRSSNQPSTAFVIDPTPQFPLSIDDVLSWRPPRIGGDGGSAPSLPEGFEAYEWSIVEQDGPFLLSERTELPVHATWILDVSLPRTGRYTIRLRVLFSDRPTEEQSVSYEVREFVIASIGDSFAAGEGNPDERGFPNGRAQCSATTLSLALNNLFGLSISMDRNPTWLERLAHRSLRSGPAQAARQIQGQWRRNDNTIVDDWVTFVSFARSGAEIFDGLLGPQNGDDDFIGAGQTEEMRRTLSGRSVDALLISIGGNDAGFSGALSDLVKKDFSIWHEWNDRENRSAVVARAERRLGAGLPSGSRGPLETAFDALIAEVGQLRQEFSIRDVYITGYPTDLFDARDNQGNITVRTCEVFQGPDLDLSRADARQVSRIGGLLNELIQRKAAEAGWIFVDVAEDFRGRGYCAGEDVTCWVSAQESCERQGDFRGMMHPNSSGQAVYALRLANALARITTVRRPGVPISPGIVGDFPDVTTPPTTPTTQSGAVNPGVAPGEGAGANIV
jgi:hypothetical protein